MSILITGANSFIAAHCISLFLSSNIPVRATVRSASKASSTYSALTAANIPNLTSLDLIVIPDITDVNQLAPALDGCTAILHLASAFNYDAKPGEFEEKLLLPALNGTLAICQAAQKYSAIRRVVIMSSFASVYDASLGLQPGRVYTEDDWCPLTYEDGRDADAVPIAYRASKAIAEKAAWEFIQNNEVNFHLVTLCPGMVFGKMIHPISSLDELNASNRIVWDVISAGEDGCMPPTKAPVWIDVEDLAVVCHRALTYPLPSHERFLVTQGSYDTQEIADIVREQLVEKRSRVPVGEPGKRYHDTHYSCDSGKVQKTFGVGFKTLEESIIPLARQLYAME